MKKIWKQRYQIIEESGTGGNGKVYKVLDLHLEKEWAMKILDEKNASFLLKNTDNGIAILRELSKVRELVKTDNLKQKLADWDEEFKDLKENKIDNLTDLITEADFLIERRDYKTAIKKIAYIEMTLESLRKKTETLLEQIKVITGSEERNRSIVTKLKVIYRELESKFERTEKDYGPLCDNIKEELKNIDKKFKVFESHMDKNDYVSVEKIVIDLEENINKLKSYIEITPSLILIGTIMIPNKIEETKTLYFRMQRDGYPLDYLNIEYNIKEIEKKGWALTPSKYIEFIDHDLDIDFNELQFNKYFSITKDNNLVINSILVGGGIGSFEETMKILEIIMFIWEFLKSIITFCKALLVCIFPFYNIKKQYGYGKNFLYDVIIKNEVWNYGFFQLKKIFFPKNSTYTQKNDIIC